MSDSLLAADEEVKEAKKDTELVFYHWCMVPFVMRLLK